MVLEEARTVAGNFHRLERLAETDPSVHRIKRVEHRRTAEYQPKADDDTDNTAEKTESQERGCEDMHCRLLGDHHDASKDRIPARLNGAHAFYL
jgi:hypothetical protein